MEPGTPAPPGGSSQPSALGTAIATNDPGAVDAALTRTYRQVIKPEKPGRLTSPAYNEQNQRITTAVDQIIGNRGALKLTNEAGLPATPGSMPKTIQQFSQAVDQTKHALFQKYDAAAAVSGEMGARVDLSPAVAELRRIAKEPGVADVHPEWVPELEAFAGRLESKAFYTPSQAQDVIEQLNQDLRTFYRSGNGAKSSKYAPVTTILRDQLDDAISGATGPGYQALKHQYGSLRSIEKDVASAVHREASKSPGLFSAFADLAASERAIHGVLSLDPNLLASAAGVRIAKQAVKYINDPNRAIERMFARRSQGPTPTLMDQISPALGPAVRAGAIGMGDDEQGGVGYRLPRTSIGGP
jgi:hypothetical protein